MIIHTQYWKGGINMKREISVVVDSCLYYETVAYLEEEKDIHIDLYNSFTENEKETYHQMSKNGNFSHYEFMLYSAVKSFESVIECIKAMELNKYAYLCSLESVPLESFDDIDIKYWSNRRDTAINILNKSYLWLKSKYDSNIYSDKIDEVFSKIQKNVPLDVSQSILGKKFYRISDYKAYYFVPLKHITYNMRLFNDQELWTFFPLIEVDRKISLNELTKLMSAISDKTRLQIINMVYDNSMYGKEIADKLNLKTPTVTHHINILMEVNLLNIEKVGQIKYFSLSKNKYQEIINSLENIHKAQ